MKLSLKSNNQMSLNATCKKAQIISTHLQQFFTWSEITVCVTQTFYLQGLIKSVVIISFLLQKENTITSLFSHVD